MDILQDQIHLQNPDCKKIFIERRKDYSLERGGWKTVKKHLKTVSNLSEQGFSNFLTRAPLDYANNITPPLKHQNFFHGQVFKMLILTNFCATEIKMSGGHGTGVPHSRD